ncbi:hypothetical protein [Pseudonocardia xinjiangensis]|uniref:Cytosine deaminase n=1 Tax=Pseudonocardia xinjiangensis TaxID=75289 RepID=A0ABX1R5S2_9PSEU|nr:hypothetical protein [Pseudonocardia xinjiangensis]NMH75748.1 hypothetical protein [Pseudonocardia xinjiangensis]
MRSTQPVCLPEAVPHLAGTVVRALRGVRLLDGTVADLLVADGVIEAVVAHEPGVLSVPDQRPGGDVLGSDLDASGWRVLPAACEPHAHLDKALTAPRTDPGAGNDLVAAIGQWRAVVPGIDGADISTRALAAVHRYVARGITAVRTHVDVLPDGDRLRGIDALVALRERLRGRVTLQVCLLAGSEVPDAVIAEALARGIDIVGGCPHLAPNPRREIGRMLDVAERHGLPVDLHADEQTDVGGPDASLDIVGMARQVLARGLAQRVTASHCVRAPRSWAGGARWRSDELRAAN